MKRKKFKKIIKNNITLLAGLGLGVSLLFFLGIVIYVKTELLAGSSVQEKANKKVEVIYNPTTEEDPFITHVPEEYFEANKNGKMIFISSADPWQGQLGAPVSIIAFFSFRDEASKDLYNLLDQIQEKYQEKVLIFWKDYPMSEEAKTDAAAAHCAQEQGKFWEYTKAAINGQEYTIDLQDCLANGETMTIVNSNYFYGRSLGIQQAPVLYINQKKFDQDFTFDNLDSYISNEINTQ